MNTLISILLATFSITLGVWIAVAFIFLKKEFLNKITIFLVSLSAGALMGGAFFHLLPEAIEELSVEKSFIIFVASFAVFFFIEKLLHWRHCHQGECAVHSFGKMNLIGDSIHNFIDGLVIASAFMLDTSVGIATTFAIAIHEIPQEIGDYGVLIHAGYHRKKALILNYIVSCTVVLGGVFGFIFFSKIENILPYLLPFAAGGFIYIATSDLIPEIRKDSNIKKSIINFLIFIAGIILMFILAEHGH